MRPQADEETLAQLLRRGVAVGFGSPAESTSPVQDLFGAHQRDDVGMGAHPDTGIRDLSQDGVDAAPVLASADRVDPHQDAVDGVELVADNWRDAVAMHDRSRVDADTSERVEHRPEPLVGRDACAPGFVVTAPEHGDNPRILHPGRSPRSSCRLCA